METKSKMLKYLHMGESIERKGIRFYSSAFRRVIDPNSKNLLKFLVYEEKLHLQYFMGLEKKVRKGQTDGMPKRLKNPIFSKSAYKKLKGNRATIFNIFNTALDIETKSIRLYSSIARKTRDRKLKMLLKRLVSFEMNHFRLIKQHQGTLYNYLYWEVREQGRIEM